ncbi:MAG: thioredoxin-like domain-containing protein [Planctomycetota bacterium]
MFPHERSLVEKFAGKPFVIIGVNSDKDLDAVRPKFVEEKITWRSFWCGEEGTRGAIPTRWNVRGWPTLVVIDHDGVIRNKWLGSPGDAVIDETLEGLVEKAAAAGGK